MQGKIYLYINGKRLTEYNYYSKAKRSAKIEYWTSLYRIGTGDKDVYLLIVPECDYAGHQWVLNRDERIAVRDMYVRRSFTHGMPALAKQYNVSQTAIWNALHETNSQTAAEVG